MHSKQIVSIGCLFRQFQRERKERPSNVQQLWYFYQFYRKRSYQKSLILFLSNVENNT